MVFSLEELKSSERREDKKTSDGKTIVSVRIGGKTLGGRQDPWPQEELRTQSECSELTSGRRSQLAASSLPFPNTTGGLPCQISLPNSKHTQLNHNLQID